MLSKRLLVNLYGLTAKEALTIFNSIKVIKGIYKLQREESPHFGPISSPFEEICYQLLY